jgi:hypothetical protein
MANWKDIKGYEGLYQINELGEVKSLDRLARCGKYGKVLYKGKTLRPGRTSNGYYSVSLGKQRKFRTYLVHRLVGETFLSNPNNYLIVMHRDNDKSNNNVDNLQWGTQSMNIMQSVREGRWHNQFTK